MEKREQASWLLGVIASIIAIGSAWTAYHADFATKEEIKAGLGATFLFLKSQNQNQQLCYRDGNCADDERVQGLKYEEQWIDNQQKALGIKPDE